MEGIDDSAVSTGIIPGRGVCPSCGGEARLGDLLCRREWVQLPQVVRQDVLLALRRFRNGDIALKDLRAAQQQAIDLARSGL